MAVGVAGIGYVGLPLAVAFAQAGRDVVAMDVDRRKIDALREGRSYIEDVPDEQLQAVLGQIEATTRPAALARCDAVLICVPTPLIGNREPELGPLIASAWCSPGCCRPASSSCSSRRRTRGPPVSGWHRFSSRRDSWPGRTSTSPSRRSASIPAARTSRCARLPRSSVV
jgi:hypothetical protein